MEDLEVSPGLPQGPNHHLCAQIQEWFWGCQTWNSNGEVNGLGCPTGEKQVPEPAGLSGGNLVLSLCQSWEWGSPGQYLTAHGVHLSAEAKGCGRNRLSSFKKMGSSLHHPFKGCQELQQRLREGGVPVAQEGRGKWS